MTARQLYSALRQQLEAAGFSAAVERHVLFETAVGRRYTEIDAEQAVPDVVVKRAFALARRRIGNYPLQYIAGSWPFLDFTLHIGEGVLIPRPETEQAALAAIRLLDGVEKPHVLDLCSGSGCLAIAIARAVMDSAVAAVECADAAFAHLRQNVSILAPEIQTIQADVLICEDRFPESFYAMIVSNPPYVRTDEYKANLEELRYEPKEAFIGGEDGLNFYRVIIEKYRPKLKPGGVMLFETGFDQTEDVSRIFMWHGYHDITVLNDAAELPRMVYARI